MSAVAAEKLRHVEELQLPSREKIEVVLPHLTDEGRSAMLTEILEALADAKETHDLRPVNHVIEAWYRTLLFKVVPEHDDRMKAPESDDAPRMDIDEVSRRLHIA